MTPSTFGNAITSNPATTSRWHSARAVLAGFVAIFVVTTATDVALHLSGVYPAMGVRMSDALFALATLYRAVYGIGGSYLTARLAPNGPLRHALFLGALGFAFSVVGALVMGKAGPLWYSLAVIAMALPCGWLGGRLAVRG